jgi:hypothetical protein
MTDAILEARQTMKTAIEEKIAELMQVTIDRLKSELADAVLDSGINPLNEIEVVDGILEQLIDADFADTLRLVAVEVPAA